MTVIKVKNSNVGGRVPAAGDLQPAELALNLQDKKLYSKDVSGQVFEIGVLVMCQLVIRLLLQGTTTVICFLIPQQRAEVLEWDCVGNSHC